MLNDPQDLNARGEFAWAATLALNGLTHLGISYGFPNHMIEHSMSAISDVMPHGAGLSVIMPAWMQWYQSQTQLNSNCFKEIFMVGQG